MPFTDFLCILPEERKYVVFGESWGLAETGHNIKSYRRDENSTFSGVSKTHSCINVTILIFIDFPGKLSDFLSKSMISNPKEETLAVWEC